MSRIPERTRPVLGAPRPSPHVPRPTSHVPCRPLHGPRARARARPTDHAAGYVNLAIIRVSMAETRPARSLSFSASSLGPMPRTRRRSSCRSDFPGLSAALDEALALQCGPPSVRSLCEQEHRVRCGALQVIGDASLPARNVFCELLREGGHLERDAVDIEVLVWKRARPHGSWAVERARARARLSWIVLRGRGRVFRGSWIEVRGSWARRRDT